MGIAIYDENGALLDINRSCRHIYGMPDPAGAKGFNLFDDFHLTQEVVGKLVAGESVRFEAAFDFDGIKRLNPHRTTKTGVSHLDVLITPLIEEDTTAGYMLHVQDVTESKKTVAALQRSEEKNRSTLEAIPDLMFRLSRDGVCLDFRAHDETDLYLAKNEIIGSNIKDTLPPEFVDACLHHIARGLDTGGLQNFEYHLPFPDGNRYFEARLVKSGNDEVLAIVRNITERKRTEQALKESEDRFRLLVESAPMSIMMLRSGKYVYSNPAGASLMGFDHPDDVIGMEALQTIAPEYHEALRNRMARIGAGASNAPMEIKLRKPDGSTVWTLSSSVSVQMDGEPTAVIVGQDITLLKHTEEALRRSEEMFRDVVSSIPGAVYQIVRRPDGTFEIPFMSRGAGHLFDRPVEELRDASRLFDDLHPDDLAPMRASIDRSARDMTEWSQEFRILPKAGGLKWLRGTSTPRSLDDGGICWSGVLLDITDRKAAEHRLSALASVVESSDDIIVVKDLDLRVVATNQGFVRASGRSSVYEMIGKTDAEIFGVTPDSEPVKSYMADERRAQRLPPGQHILREEPVFCPDGSTRTYLTKKYPIYDGEGRVIGTGNISRDITEMRKLEQRIQQAQKMESIGNLAGGIAHDFNNILFPIVGMAEMLVEDLPPDSPERESAEEIFNAGKRGSDLVKQILAFSRQSEHRKMPVRLQHILKEVLKLIRATVPADIDIDQDIQSDCGLVMADPVQIHQVAMNIITNAYHAVEDNSGRIAVQLKEIFIPAETSAGNDLPAGRYARLSIRDTGHGMAPDLMEKIFEPYFTTKEQGKGTGLGLAVAYGIVKEHAGHIEVRSELRKGAAFDVYLPLMESTEVAEPVDAAGEIPTGNEEVLLVDDEEPIARLETQLLHRLGYRVSYRTSSREALEAFRADSGRFDLVITDMTMPWMTGLQLARELIAIRSDIPIIICTGFSERINAEKAREMGIGGFVMKPVVKSELATMVRKVLDEAKGDVET